MGRGGEVASSVCVRVRARGGRLNPVAERRARIGGFQWPTDGRDHCAAGGESHGAAVGESHGAAVGESHGAAVGESHGAAVGEGHWTSGGRGHCVAEGPTLFAVLFIRRVPDRCVAASH
jgi:hypothetical protein